MDNFSTRRTNFMLLLHQELQGSDVVPHADSTHRFAQRIGLSDERLSDLQNGSLDFDDVLARDIEKRLSIPAGWLDQEHSAFPGDQDASHRQQRLDDLHRASPPSVREALIEKEEAHQQSAGTHAGKSSNVVSSN